jgi:hypothetical protein
VLLLLLANFTTAGICWPAHFTKMLLLLLLANFTIAGNCW